MGPLDDLGLLPNLRLIPGIDNCGMGAAFDTGVLAARGIAVD
ncbi:hypothetical protein ABT025_28455 [Streptomyces sp. NPDC002809]